jgi:uncharacterized phage protein (TIGR01671 family)
MNRQIKFRGLRIDGKGWAVGSRLELNDNGVVRVFIVPLSEQVVSINGKEHFHWDGLIEVKPETVGQFTGLTDKNGKEVFEGDLVKYRYYPVGEDKNVIEYYKKGIIIFSGTSFGLQYKTEGTTVLNPKKAMSYHKTKEDPFVLPSSRNQMWIDNSLEFKELHVSGNIHEQ